MRLLSVVGTRPEAIKMAPVLLELRDRPGIQSLLCATGQHRELVDEPLALFGLVPDFDLGLMEHGQSLNRLASRALAALDALLGEVKPDRLIVQGDTTTALAAALAAFHRGIPVAHVEAGLRTYAPRSPWPEETNRRAVALVADLHFAPTEAARDHLAGERLHGRVFVTGNSGIDALRLVAARLERDPRLRSAAEAALPCPASDRKLILVTLHRRESRGTAMRGIWKALALIARRGDVEIAFPLHPDVGTAAGARAALGGVERIHLLPPLGLAAFVALMRRADLVLTDSGGVQEEAVALGRPVLVARDSTERGEAVAAGAARLIGTGGGRIARELAALLDGPALFALRPDLFGDGRAASRIVAGLAGDTVAEFASSPKVTAAAE